MPKNDKSNDLKLVANGRITDTKRTVLSGGIDVPYLVIFLVLLCFGTIMTLSASYSYAQSYTGGDSYYFIRRQIFYIIGGMAAIVAVILLFTGKRLNKIRHSVWVLFFFASICLCILVLIPSPLSVTTGGASRWLRIFGIQFQPSEILKISAIFLCASHINRYFNRMNEFFMGFGYFGLLIVTGAIVLLLQPHASGTIIYSLIIIAMMFIGGTPLSRIIASGLVGAGAMGVVILNLAHASERIDVWFEPESHLMTGGWQPTQSLYAICSGEFWGLGLGRSRQKHGYLPQPQNDYVFAITCEELGFFGAVLIIILFCLLIWRGYDIARRCTNGFLSLVAMGITTKLLIQVLLNMLVVTNLIPSTGISLPFFSYGGTQLITQMAEIGIVLSISKTAYIIKE